MINEVVGKWFHLVISGKLIRQGRILNKQDDGRYLVQLFANASSDSHQRYHLTSVNHIKEKNYKLFDTEEAMRDAWDKALADGSRNDLVGKWFHYVVNGKLTRKGHVLSKQEDGRYLVQLFNPDKQGITDLERLNSVRVTYKYFDSVCEMLDAWDNAKKTYTVDLGSFTVEAVNEDEAWTKARLAIEEGSEHIDIDQVFCDDDESEED